MESVLGMITVIITCYNYEKYIERAIKSVLEQKLVENSIEIIVVNDGSIDNSLEVINKYRDQVTIIDQKNQGLEKSVNNGIKISNGEYILRLDADDYLENHCLFILKLVLENNKNIDFVYGDYYLNDNGVRSYKSLPSFDKSEINSRGDFLATATLFRKRILIEAGLYDESVKNCGLENYDLILRMLNCLNASGYCINVPMFTYDYHNLNMSYENREKIVEYGEIIAKRYGLISYKTNQYHPYGLEI